MQINWDSAEEDIVDIQIDQDWIQSSKEIGKMSVVAKIFSRKPFLASFIRSPLKTAWALEGSLDVCELGDNLSVLTFENKEEKDKVLAIGAWNYDRCLMVLQDFDGNLKPSEFVFDKATFWVQVHDLPLDLMTIQVAKALGNHIGQFLEVDAFKNSVAWGRFLCIKVSIPIDKPLKRGCVLNVPNKGKFQVFYRYENLPEFCDKCGVLSCYGQDCDVTAVNDPVFGDWLRASSAIEKTDFPDPKIREEEDFVIVEDSNAPVQMEEKEIEDGDDNFLDHENYEGTDSSVGSESDLYSQRTYKIYCKAAPDFHLTVRDGQVVLARSDPSDPFQNWFKDKAFVKQLKDEEGRPCFALVNKATAQSIKHAVGGGHPVELAPYYLDVFDESVLWTLSKDFGDGYRTMRMVNDISLNMDAFQGDEKSGGVHDGTKIVLWGWNHGDNQLWKVARNPH